MGLKFRNPKFNFLSTRGFIFVRGQEGHSGTSNSAWMRLLYASIF